MVPVQLSLHIYQYLDKAHTRLGRESPNCCFYIVNCKN